MDDIGFIIVRHVETIEQSEYWKECYTSIRKFYPDKKIIIVDNDSDVNLIDFKFELTNCEIINSEIPDSRFFAPFYYLLTKNFDFEVAVILHDGMIFTDYINFDNIEECKFLWHFTTKCYLYNVENLLSELVNSDSLLKTYQENNWIGSLGATGVFNISFLRKLEEQYKITTLKNKINSGESVQDWERIIGIIMYHSSEKLKYNLSYFGDCVNNFGINFDILYWRYSFQNYLIDKVNNNLRTPLIKIFGGRV